MAVSRTSPTPSFFASAAGSIWSAVNIAKMAAPSASGRMCPASVVAFACRTGRKLSVYACEQVGALQLGPHELRAFKTK